MVSHEEGPEVRGSGRPRLFPRLCPAGLGLGTLSSSSGQMVLMQLRSKAGQKGEWKRAFPFVSYYFYQERKYAPEASRRLLLASSDFSDFLCPQLFPSLHPWPRSMGWSGSLRPIMVHPLVLSKGSPLESRAPMLE